MALIDVGAAAIDRTSDCNNGITYVTLDNPANAAGIISAVEIYAFNEISSAKIGSFVVNGGDPTKYTCRDYSIFLYSIYAGLNTIITNFVIAVGDYIGIVFAGPGTAKIEYGIGGADVYFKSGDQFDAGEQTYALMGAGSMISLHGKGFTPGVGKGQGSTSSGLLGATLI